MFELAATSVLPALAEVDRVAQAHALQRFCQKIIMDAEMITVISWIIHPERIKRKVADNHIKELIRVIG